MLLYIDPGTGSMLFTILIGVLGAAFYSLRMLWIKLRFKLGSGKVAADMKGLPFVKSFIRRITTDKKLLQYVLNMTELHMRPNMLYVQKSKIKSTNKLFDLAVEPYDLIHLAMADNLGKIPHEATEETETFLKDRLEIYNEYMSRDYVTGKDLIAMEITPGEKFTQILEFAHKLRLSGVSKENVIKQIEVEYKKDV